MKIGLYNRHLATLGGGERHSLAIAAHLSQSHDVTVISHTPVPPERIAAVLNLDLGNLRFEIVPEQPAARLGPLAARYDLFVNASNLDFVPPAAPRNALLVYFPIAPPTGPGARLRRGLAHWITEWAHLPRFVAGVYGEQRLDNVTVRGLGPCAEIDLPSLRQPYPVELVLRAADPAIRRAVVEVEGGAPVTLELMPDRFTTADLTVAPGGAACRRLRITAGPVGADTDAPIALYLAELRPRHTRYARYRGLFEQRFPGMGVRLRNQLPPDLAVTASKYDLIWAISRYTQRWITRYWGLESALVYPMVEVERFYPGNKQPRILSVGRFFAGSHNKQHLTMIRAFKEMVDAGLAGWELHLAGGATPGAIHAAYRAEVQAAAAGYPIHVHVDLPYGQLVELYAGGSIYWHASGYGEDERRDPIKFEHFGITTVEAMAAACAPVVIGRGGQTELITPGQDGYLWYTTDELKEYTRRLIEQPHARSRIGQAALVSSRRFASAAFARQLDDSVAGLLAR